MITKPFIARHDHKPIPPGIPPDKMCKYGRKTPSQNAEFLSLLPIETGHSLTIEQGSGSVQEDFDQFYRTTIIEILDRFYPEKEIKITARDPDYMTPSIKSKLRKKNKLMHKPWPAAQSMGKAPKLNLSSWPGPRKASKGP